MAIDRPDIYGHFAQLQRFLPHPHRYTGLQQHHHFTSVRTSLGLCHNLCVFGDQVCYMVLGHLRLVFIVFMKTFRQDRGTVLAYCVPSARRHHWLRNSHLNDASGCPLCRFVRFLPTLYWALLIMDCRFLMASSYCGFIVFYAWISNSIPRPPAKRAVAIAFINAFSQLGNISGSYIWPKNWGPSYRYSYAICIACSGLCIIMCFIFRTYLTNVNKRLDKEEEEKGQTVKGFRYLV